MKCDELTSIDLECNMGKDINGVEHREPWKAYDIDEVNAAITELKDENRRLKRALYKACANWAMAESYSVLNDVPTANRWIHTLRKLEAKLEAFK